MRKLVTRHGIVGVVMFGLTLGLIATTAVATPPGAGVKSKVLATSRVGHTMYTLAQVTIPPGQSTGWHYHNGPVYGRIVRGTLTHDNAQCQQDGLYHRGDLVVEQPGRNHVHIGRNLGKVPLVLDVLYVDPVGKALAVSAPNPGCPFH